MLHRDTHENVWNCRTISDTCWVETHKFVATRAKSNNEIQHKTWVYVMIVNCIAATYHSGKKIHCLKSLFSANKFKTIDSCVFNFNRFIRKIEAAFVKIFSQDLFSLLGVFGGWKCCNDEKSNIIVVVYRKDVRLGWAAKDRLFDLSCVKTRECFWGECLDNT